MADILYYKFDNSAVDSTNASTFVGTNTSYANCKFDQGLKVNGGSASYGMITFNNAWTPGLSDFTIGFWATGTNLQAWQSVLMALGAANEERIQLNYGSSPGGFGFEICGNGGYRQSGNNIISPTVPSFVTLVRKNGQFQMCVNGIVSYIDSAYSNLSIGSIKRIAIGGDYSGWTGGFPGVIDDLFITDKALYWGAYTPPTAAYISGKFLFRTADGDIYDYTTQLNNRGKALDNTTLLSLLTNYGVNNIPTPSQLAPLGNNFTLLCLTPDSISSKTNRIIACSNSKLLLSNSDIGLSSIQSINSSTITAGQAGNGKVLVIVSVDSGTTWKTWDSLNNVWISIDTSNLNNVANGAMTPAVVGARTKADWANLIGNLKVIRFGYYLETSATTDIGNTDMIVMNVDMRGRWRTQTPGVSYDSDMASNNAITISIYAAGDYKINY